MPVCSRLGAWPVSYYRICPNFSQNRCRPPLISPGGIPANSSSYVGHLSLRRSTRSAMSGGYFQSGLSLLPRRHASRSRRSLALSDSYSRNIPWNARYSPSGLLNVAGVTRATQTSSEYLPSLWKQRAFSITRASWFRSGSCVTLKLMSLSHFISQKHIHGWGLRPRLMPLMEVPRLMIEPIARSTWVLRSLFLGGNGKTSSQSFASSGWGRYVPVRMFKVDPIIKTARGLNLESLPPGTPGAGGAIGTGMAPPGGGFEPDLPLPQPATIQSKTGERRL